MAPATNHNKRFGKVILNVAAETVNFHFPYYKPIGTIRWHRNQSYPNAIKNTVYIEANVISMYAYPQ